VYWSPNFLSVGFKKQEISQQVISHTFHLFYLVLTTRSATTAKKLKFWNWLSPWHACCLLGYTRPKPTNESKLSSHENAGFSIRVFKNFPGVIPPNPHNRRGRPTPAPTHSPACGRAPPGVGTQTSVPSTFQPWLRPCLYRDSKRVWYLAATSSCGERVSTNSRASSFCRHTSSTRKCSRVSRGLLERVSINFVSDVTRKPTALPA